MGEVTMTIDFDDSQLSKRFWSKVDVKDNINDCWLWTAGGLNKSGQAIFTLGRNARAISYRMAYALYFEVQLDSFGLLMHSCDNSKCCNPNHLSEGTQKENMADCKAKGRWKGNSKLTFEDIEKIRDLAKTTDLLQREIAERFNVNRTAISRILTGVRWSEDSASSIAARANITA